LNLYRLFYQNKHDDVAVRREQLFLEVSGKHSIGEQHLMEILSNEGITLAEDFGHSSVRNVTKKAFTTDNLEEKILALRRIRGVGFVAATAILSYQNPFKYAKIDNHTYNQLVKNFDFPLPEKDKAGEFSAREYETYLNALRALADEYGMKPPDVEFVLNLLDKGKIPSDH